MSGWPPTIRPVRSRSTERQPTAPPSAFPYRDECGASARREPWVRDRVAEDGFAEFTRARWGRLVRLAYSLTLDVGRAEDLVQESLAKLWTKWPQVRDGAPEAYVRQTI